MSLTQEALKAVLHYDPETGAFTRMAKGRGMSKLGRISNAGPRLKIMVYGTRYFAHRLAWLYVLGEWPSKFIDHINGNPLDNRFANLRDASRALNVQNQRRARSDNLTGMLGVRRKEYQRLVGVFDDRDKVVRMWRDAGVTCFQVAPGEF